MDIPSPDRTAWPAEQAITDPDCAAKGGDGGFYARLTDEINAYLGKLDPSSDEFVAYLDSLTEDGLRCFNYDLFYFNLLSLFGDKLSAEDISALATRCTRYRLRRSWESYIRIGNMMAQSPSVWKPKLQGWELDRLQRLLGLGKGLIICTAHVGAYREIPLDLALLGYRTGVALDEAMARFFRNFLNRCKVAYEENKTGTETPFVDRLWVADVEADPLATLTIMNALRRNEIVVFFADGNSGLDGRWGKKNKLEFPFLNRLISVRAGAAYIAATVQAPVLSLLTLEGADGNPRIAYQDEIVFQQSVDSAERQSAGGDFILSLYQKMETVVTEHPEQWESACFFHRWRIPDAPIRLDVEAERQRVADTERLLRLGARFRLNHKRVSAIWSPTKGEMLVDVDTLITYCFPGDVRSMVSALCNGGSVDQHWLKSDYSISVGYDHLVRTLAKIRHLCAVHLLEEETA
jgi:lauroyl/myristoyl acyltransferase